MVDVHDRVEDLIKGKVWFEGKNRSLDELVRTRTGSTKYWILNYGFKDNVLFCLVNTFKDKAEKLYYYKFVYTGSFVCLEGISKTDELQAQSMPFDTFCAKAEECING